MAAHPRAGGENQDVRLDVRLPSGSSPRGRGKRVFLTSRVCQVGLIPARAGKTCPKTTPRSGRPAHPRAGGENVPPLTGISILFGSSPRGRGKLQHRRVGHDGRGLIPARAGKTRITTRRTCAPTAHPRAGGENLVEPPRCAAAGGSSPRGRGKHPVRAHAGTDRGLIPARAGKT